MKMGTAELLQYIGGLVTADRVLYIVQTRPRFEYKTGQMAVRLIILVFFQQF